MPRYYIEEYARALRGKPVWIACREGILRDHFKHIVADIKFLNRHQIETTFFHNLSNRFANQQHFRNLAERLPATHIVRVPADVDFYTFVLGYKRLPHKIIFIERKGLIDHDGYPVNSLSTERARQSFASYEEAVANVNLKGLIGLICDRIDQKAVERVHLLPAGKCTIKQELFTIEGSGTLIADNFSEEFRRVGSEKEAGIIAGILAKYKGGGYLKQRTTAYVSQHREDFFLVMIDNIVVGCCEKLSVDETCVELGALAISTKFRNQRVGVFLINRFLDEMESQGYAQVISLTRNPRLGKLYLGLGFEPVPPERFSARQAQSPGVTMYLKQFVNAT